MCDDAPAIRRRRAGRGFVYFDAKGGRIADTGLLKRIRALVIPPAWTDVWICASANGHIQATGRDAKGRKQYKYHAEYREAREQSKYEHLFEFAAALPTIRATVAEHMSLRGLPREKVLATVVHLLETTLIRVGAAVKQVAAALGNTPAVCRKSYIHPAICSAYLDGALALGGRRGRGWRVGADKSPAAGSRSACASERSTIERRIVVKRSTDRLSWRSPAPLSNVEKA